MLYDSLSSYGFGSWPSKINLLTFSILQLLVIFLFHLMFWGIKPQVFFSFFFYYNYEVIQILFHVAVNCFIIYK